MRMLWNMLVKELIQLRRDPKILMVLFVAPLVQLTILGYAATTDIRRVELAVCDLDRTPVSRGLIEDFTASTYFRVVARVDTQDALDPWLASGAARVAVTIPAGLSADRATGRPARVQVVADGSDAMVGTLGLAYAQGVLRNAALQDGAPVARATGSPVVHVASVSWRMARHIPLLPEIPRDLGRRGTGRGRAGAEARRGGSAARANACGATG